MNVKVPSNISVSAVEAPASKSYAQRAILAACLSEEMSTIRNVGSSSDVEHIIEIARQLGAQVSGQKDLKITGKMFPPKMVLNCGESGLGMRMATSVAAAIGGEFKITGHGSLLKRPMTELTEILPKLGLEVRSQNGFPPLHINGFLQGGVISVDGSNSSQYLSGLLMGLPVTGQASVITVQNPSSKPYIQMTLDLIKKAGIEVDNNDYETFRIKGNQQYKPLDYTVEGDWSGAAFWVVLGVIQEQITISNLNESSLQADRAILDVLDISKSEYSWDSNNLTVSPSEIKPFEFDATNCPDLFPILVVLAAASNGTSTITGVERLKYKESDRGIVLQKEFGKLGLDIEINGNQMMVHGTGRLKSGAINSNNDHRIAMAGAIASALTDEGVMVEDAEAVKKSYPDFWIDMGIKLE